MEAKIVTKTAESFMCKYVSAHILVHTSYGPQCAAFKIIAFDSFLLFVIVAAFPNVIYFKEATCNCQVQRSARRENANVSCWRVYKIRDELATLCALELT